MTTLDLDVTDEGSIEKAANHVKSKFGSGNLRLLINVAGIVSFSSIPYSFEDDRLMWGSLILGMVLMLQLHPEKSIQKIDYEHLLETFKVGASLCRLYTIHLVLLPRLLEWQEVPKHSHTNTSTAACAD